jgi:D-aminoacyl-tRNA deacylase
MIAVIQRVSEASVVVDNERIGSINQGFLVLLGIGNEDKEEDISWLSKKIVGLRIFSDEEGKMNLDIKQVGGNVLLISQFTLMAASKKGNRPSYINAAHPSIAEPLYEQMIAQLSQDIEQKIEVGRFGADMKVTLTNDGPVTIIIDTKNRV